MSAVAPQAVECPRRRVVWHSQQRARLCELNALPVSARSRATASPYSSAKRQVQASRWCHSARRGAGAVYREKSAPQAMERRCTTMPPRLPRAGGRRVFARAAGLRRASRVICFCSADAVYIGVDVSTCAGA